MMEQKQIFRKAAIDRMLSPEQLNDYIRVGSPSVWVILAAVIVILASLFVWVEFGRVEVTKTDANGLTYIKTVRLIEFILPAGIK